MKKSVKLFRGKYGFLSNMYDATFEWDGRTYLNSEAAFQSAKSLDPEVRDSFSRMGGKEAKSAGRNVLLRKDWEGVKDALMEEIVRAKFAQNPELLRQLVETGDMELIEGNRWHDTYWGVDTFSGEGENHLGIILMKVRAELGGGDYLERAAEMEAERRAEAERQEAERRAARDGVAAELEALPAYDFTGMTMGTRAFGKVTILRQEGDYLFFNARGAEKKFALPGCITQGFLIPEDPEIAETFRRREALLARLRELDSEAKQE